MFRYTQFAVKTLSILSLSALASSPSIASSANDAPNSSGWSWSAQASTLNIDSKVAREQYIEDSAFDFGFAAERYSAGSINTWTIGIDFISYRDNASFSQLTNKGNKDSDANAMLAYVEFGPKVHFGGDKSNYFTAHVGASGIFGSERGIGYCTNCYSEKIDVGGGAYGSLGVGHSFSSFDLGLQFQQYFSGDLDNSLRLKVSSTF